MACIRVKMVSSKPYCCWSKRSMVKLFITFLCFHLFHETQAMPKFLDFLNWKANRNDQSHSIHDDGQDTKEASDRILYPPTFPYWGPFGFTATAILCPLFVGPFGGSWNRACAGPVPPFVRTTTTEAPKTTTTPTPESSTPYNNNNYYYPNQMPPNPIPYNYDNNFNYYAQQYQYPENNNNYYYQRYFSPFNQRRSGTIIQQSKPSSSQST